MSKFTQNNIPCLDIYISLRVYNVFPITQFIRSYIDLHNCQIQNLSQLLRKFNTIGIFIIFVYTFAAPNSSLLFCTLITSQNMLIILRFTQFQSKHYILQDKSRRATQVTPISKNILFYIDNKLQFRIKRQLARPTYDINYL